MKTYTINGLKVYNYNENPEPEISSERIVELFEQEARHVLPPPPQPYPFYQKWIRRFLRRVE